MDYNIFNSLASIIDTIPPIIYEGNNYKVRFMFGSQADLMRYLKLERQTSNTMYPLIWLETPIELEDLQGYIGKIQANFIIANISTQNMTNFERIAFNFDRFINPVTKDLLKALKTSGITKYTDKTEQDFFNYLAEGKGASDIWDVKQVQMTLIFKKNCELKNIYYERM